MTDRSIEDDDTVSDSATSSKRGHPDGAHPLAPLVYIGALFVLGAAGWGLVALCAWAVWVACVYTLAVLSFLLSLAMAVLAGWLVVHGNMRGRIAAGVLLAGAVALVIFTTTR